MGKPTVPPNLATSSPNLPRSVSQGIDKIKKKFQRSRRATSEDPAARKNILLKQNSGDSDDKKPDMHHFAIGEINMLPPVDEAHEDKEDNEAAVGKKRPRAVFEHGSKSPSRFDVLFSSGKAAEPEKRQNTGDS